MKKIPAIWSLSAVLTLLGGCSKENEQAYEHTPVGVLDSQDHEITIHTGPDGPLYSVKDPSGKELAREISARELQAAFPKLNVSEIWADAPVVVPKSVDPLILEPIPAPDRITEHR